jgi:transcriptional regulator with XRE-family HTH domain
MIVLKMDISPGEWMDEKARAEFGKELNKGVGDLLCALREQAGLSFDQVAEAVARRRLEKIRRLEAGDASPRGDDLLELISIYGADPCEVQASIQMIASNARAKVQLMPPSP